MFSSFHAVNVLACMYFDTVKPLSLKSVVNTLTQRLCSCIQSKINPTFIRIWEAVKLSSVSCLSLMLPCVTGLCVCKNCHVCIDLIATVRVHSWVMYGQPLYSTCSLGPLAGQTDCHRTPRCSEGDIPWVQRRSDGGIIRLTETKAGSGGVEGGWLTDFESRTCRFLRLMTEAALVCHRQRHLSYWYGFCVCIVVNVYFRILRMQGLLKPTSFWFEYVNVSYWDILLLLYHVCIFAYFAY